MLQRAIAAIMISFLPFTDLSAAGPGNNRNLAPEGSSWRYTSRVLTNPAVEAMVDSVSPEGIFNDVMILAAYYTRHTNSDTISQNFGIGAARRWIYDRFQEIANDSGTYALEPSYFDFNATICDYPRLNRNVLATLPGISTPERNFVVMGHMDSRTVGVCDATSYAPSANDDGSGTAVVMEMARIMSRYQFESTVIIMPVTGEDEGLYGSTAYARWAQNQGMRIDAAITNDVVGNIEGCVNPSCPPGDSVIIDSLSVRHFSGGPETGPSRQLTRYMKLKAMEYLPGFTVNLIAAIDRPGRSGDHVPFYDRGYPAARFTEAHEYGDGSGYNGRQHNANDTVSAINTNAGYMANIARLNIAGFASLALAPQTPTGTISVRDIGDGTSVLLEWTAENNEPDFAGYRIAVRPQGQLFYSNVMDAGNVTSFVVPGLTEGQRVYLSISAYDMVDNESVFSDEISFIPSSVPQTPRNLDATSHSSNIELRWNLNNERDIQSYQIYRQDPTQGEPALIATLPYSDSQWSDIAVIPHTLYRYFIAAFDTAANRSILSSPVFGQLASHDNGILIVDGSLDGAGGPFQPTDQQVDDYFDAIMNGYNITGHWDIVDSNAVGIILADAHLAPYSTVFLHSERTGNHIEADTTILRKYLENGGKLLISGWNLSYSLGGNTSDYIDFAPGSFFREKLKVDSLGVSPSVYHDFVMAPTLMPAVYPDLIIDSVKVSLFEHRLYKMEAFLGSLVDEPLTQPLNSYLSSRGDSSQLNGEPVSLRYLGDFRLVFFDVPLYFMTMETATAALHQALADLGELPVGVENDEGGREPVEFGIYGNYPNPFNSATVIRYRLPSESHVAIGIYDLLGRKVEVLTDAIMPEGDHRVRWQATDYPSGIYFCRIQFGNTTQTARLLLLR